MFAGTLGFFFFVGVTYSASASSVTSSGLEFLPFAAQNLALLGDNST